MPTREERIAEAAKRREELSKKMEPHMEAARLKVEARVMAEAAVKKEMELRKRAEEERMAALKEQQKRILEEQAAYKKRCEEIKEHARKQAELEIQRNRMEEERKNRRIEMTLRLEAQKKAAEEAEKEMIKRVKAHKHWCHIPCHVQEKWLASKDWESIFSKLNDCRTLFTIHHCAE